MYNTLQHNLEKIWKKYKRKIQRKKVSFDKCTALVLYDDELNQLSCILLRKKTQWIEYWAAINCKCFGSIFKCWNDQVYCRTWKKFTLYITSQKLKRKSGHDDAILLEVRNSSKGRKYQAFAFTVYSNRRKIVSVC